MLLGTNLELADFLMSVKYSFKKKKKKKKKIRDFLPSPMPSIALEA